MNNRRSINPTQLTRDIVPTSFHKYLPGIKTLNYNERDVVSDVCTYFKITEDQMKMKGRKEEYRMPRQVAMYFISNYFPELTYEFIGMYLGGRNHATVTHSVKVVGEEKLTDKNYGYRIKELDEIIQSHILEKSSILK